MKETGKDVALGIAIGATDLGRGHSFGTLFEDWLDWMLSFRCGNPNERQKFLFKESKMKHGLWYAYSKAMAAYEEATEGYHDPLGNVFMERISHGARGQFFTPENICKLMAEMIEVKEGAMYDPACGSGRLLLRSLQVARERGGDPPVVAGDIDRLCSKMVLANLLSQTAYGEVQQMDALRYNVESATFYRMERVMHIGTGAIFSQYWEYTKDTAEEVGEARRKWYWDMAEHGWTTYGGKMKWREDTEEETTEEIVESVEAAPEIQGTAELRQLSLF